MQPPCISIEARSLGPPADDYPRTRGIWNQTVERMLPPGECQITDTWMHGQPNNKISENKKIIWKDYNRVAMAWNVVAIGCGFKPGCRKNWFIRLKSCSYWYKYVWSSLKKWYLRPEKWWLWYQIVLTMSRKVDAKGGCLLWAVNLVLWLKIVAIHQKKLF